MTLDYRGQVVVITVRDDGVGSLPTRTSNRQGLGLVRRLVEQVDASIEVRQISKGTCYEIELPLQTQAA